MKHGAITRASLAALVFAFVFFSLAQAVDYQSTNFILRDPVITIEGGRGTSTSFEYFSSTSQLGKGESTSTSYIQRPGFLFFPVATSSIVAATAGDGQVSLTWSASVGTLANITNYQVGTATVSGGPYTFESLGGVLSFIDTGLTNGTTYYFVVRAEAGVLALATSAEVSSTPTAPAPPSPPPSGGGGIGAPPPPITSVMFSGRAYPGSSVTLLKDAQIAVKTVAGPDSKFQISLSRLSGGSYIFSLYAEDHKGYRSSLLSFPVSVTTGATTNISGIFIAPTIAVDKSEVKRGENIAIFGQSTPLGNMTITINSDEEFFEKTKADTNGIYLLNFDTSPLAPEQHIAKSKAALAGEISTFGKVVSFTVGTRTVFVSTPLACSSRADLNADCKVNLIDFSIAAFWYKRTISVRFQVIEAERLNGDGKIDLVDFSIMAFYWTG